MGVLQSWPPATDEIGLRREIMTLEALKNAIERLIIQRRKAHGNDAEQKRISKKLTKLYDLKYLMLKQAQS